MGWLSIDDKHRDERVASARLAGQRSEQHRIKILRAKHLGESLTGYDQMEEGILRTFSAASVLQQDCVAATSSAAAVAQEALERSGAVLRNIESALKGASLGRSNGAMIGMVDKCSCQIFE